MLLQFYIWSGGLYLFSAVAAYGFFDLFFKYRKLHILSAIFWPISFIVLVTIVLGAPLVISIWSVLRRVRGSLT